MKSIFKPLGLAAAIAAGTLGMAGVSHANDGGMALSGNNVGDLALVPYYTVIGNYTTGVHIINTGPDTIITKFRLRRDSDSADVLDFNIILSPFDEWTGFIDDSSGTLTVTTSDNTCTAPNLKTFPAPNINSAGAEEGYIEIIGTAAVVSGAATAAGGTLAAAAKHTAAGVPLDCTAVESAFLTSNVLKTPLTTGISAQSIATPDLSVAVGGIALADAPNDLHVSFFIRDGDTGIEFGGNAVHISSFAELAMMADQQTIISGTAADNNGFDFPNLGGSGGAIGVAAGAAPAVPTDHQQGLYSDLRAILGTTSISNDWSFNTANGVATDWVVTIPGQYLMIDPKANVGTPTAAQDLNGDGIFDAADRRDLPLTADFIVYDREEGVAAVSGLRISPAQDGASTLLPQEVNVIQWGGQTVLDSVAPVSVTTGLASSVGWASVSLSSANGTTPEIYHLADQVSVLTTGPTRSVPLDTNLAETTTSTVSALPPIIGFAVWQRDFGNDSVNLHGRMVDHAKQQ